MVEFLNHQVAIQMAIGQIMYLRYSKICLFKYLRGVFRVLIPKINISFRKIIYTNKCQDTFTIVKDQNRVDISSGDFKSIYNFILINKVSAIKLWEQKWRVDLNNNGLNWNKIWNNVHNPIFNYKIQSSIWEMIHRNYICGYILKQMHKSDGVCKLCDKLESERTHIFIKCKIINQLYGQFYLLMRRLDSRDMTEEEKAFGIF